MLTLQKLTKPKKIPIVTHLFSSSSSNDENNLTPPSPPPLSSYFNNTKSSLQNRKPPISTETNSMERIRQNLSQFQSKTAPPSNTVSLLGLYKKNVSEKGGEEMKKTSFGSILENLQLLKRGNQNLKERDSGKTEDPYSLKQFQDTLKMKPGGGTSVPPSSMFRKEETMKTRSVEYGRSYNYTELGEKLKQLRPTDVNGKNCFSFEELNERLKKLRENEVKEMDARIGGVVAKDLRECLQTLKQTTEEKDKKSIVQRIEIVGSIGGTPNYMLQPPKEQLVEKANNMSSAEKLKLELKKVRDEFKMSESDCGSSRVQVAQLTTKIKHLSSVLHKKDKHSRKGLQEMVQRRKKLLRYLRRTDWESFCFCLDKLGLRDNPDYKN
ncbi:hypothetical protein IFM89_018563 [Coptis chinensis]|uniref:Small ribosomal subunit protein uS15c n=1 Tax=Coptis chinensis TaxID=261450 RepID=A0A835ID69_9MAGN|nr:hypothetical protein IFM89_018563 [Coptis chinensis]